MDSESLVTGIVIGIIGFCSLMLAYSVGVVAVMQDVKIGAVVYDNHVYICEKQ